MINDLIKEYGISVSAGNVIDLGTANGWSKTTREFFSKIKDFVVPNTGYSTNLGRCYNEYASKYEDGTGASYLVVHKVDSSD